MHLNWRAISEAEPGPIWAGLFREYWPDYHRWWLQDGAEARPGYWDSVKALKTHMPEMVPLYETLCDLAAAAITARAFCHSIARRPISRAAARRSGPGPNRCCAQL